MPTRKSQQQNQHDDRTHVRGRPTKPLSSSVIHNGRMVKAKDLFEEIDGRSVQARRLRTLINAFISDLGGEGLSEGQLVLIRRAAILTVELEKMESLFALEGGAETHQLDCYQRTTNTLKRLIESLGIAKGRVAREVTPDLQDYIRSKRNQSRPRIVIDHDADEDEDDVA